MFKKPMVLLLLMALALPIGLQIEAGAQETPDGSHHDQVSRLYRTTLGRDPDASGHDYWANRLIQGEPVANLASLMMRSNEAAANTSGDPIVDAYRWALGREPDASGYAYWSSKEPVAAVVAISDSAEHQGITNTQPPPPLPLVATHPSGWVDAGHGVYVPPILLSIRYCESKDNYTAANPRSSARGGYQFLTSSWAAYGHAARYGVSRAHLATPAQQDEAALLTWQQDGTRPWLASRYCWS